MTSQGRAGRWLGLLACCLLTLGARVAPAQTVRTIVGQGNEDGLLATQVPLDGPYSITVDPTTGAIYTVELGMLVPGGGALIALLTPQVRLIAPDGTIRRVAGNRIRGNAGDGGPATEAQLNLPRRAALDGRGNLYIVDQGAHKVRRVDPQGVITTFAGTGVAGYSGDGGKATEAQLSAPRGIAVDPADGTVYIADTGNNRVRRVTPDGTITTFAGTGAVDFNALEGRATEVNLGSPRGMVVDRQGNLIVAEFNTHRIRRITRDGALTTIAGNGEQGVGGDGGPARNAAIEAPFQMALDAAGNLYVTQPLHNVIRRIAADGTISTVAGTGKPGFNGEAGSARELALNTPLDVAVAPNGDVMIVDSANSRIRRLTPDGRVSTLAGGAGASGLHVSQVTVLWPRGGVRDRAGNFYVADTGHRRILKISPDGIVTVIMGNGAPTGYKGEGLKATEVGIGDPTAGQSHVDGLAVDAAGNVYVPDLEQHRVFKVDTNGILTTVAGNGEAGFSGDGGKATEASLSDGVWNVALDAQGNLYIADGNNHRVRRVDTNGIITTVAGNGSENYSGDGGPAVEAGIPGPDGLFVGADGSIYIGDTTDNRIRKVTPDGKITTIAGTGEEDFSGDGGPATQAAIFGPENIAVDAAGNVYFADADNDRIRKIDTNGIITTFAGTGNRAFNGDDKSLKEIDIASPRDLYIDAQGNLIFAQFPFTAEPIVTHRVRIINLAP